MSNLTPVPIDSDERANRKAIDTVFGAFQTETPPTKPARRVTASAITKTKTQPMNETKHNDTQLQSTTPRELRSHDVSIHDELRLSSSDRIIDAALSTVSHMARVMVETDLSQTKQSAQLISFHAAAENPTIPEGASYLRTAIDPTNTISRVHLYSRIADNTNISTEGGDDPVLDRPAII